MVNQVRDGLPSSVLSNMHESSLNEAVEMTTNLFSLVEKGHYELGMLFNDHHETVSSLPSNDLPQMIVAVADRLKFSSTRRYMKCTPF